MNGGAGEGGAQRWSAATGHSLGISEITDDDDDLYWYTIL